MKPSLRPVLLLACGGILFSLISFFVWLEANDSPKRMLFGKVQSTNDSELILEQRDGSTETFLLVETTKVVRGKETSSLETLSPGDFVQVGVSDIQKSPKTAEIVRVMRTPKDDAPHDKR